MSLSGGSPEGQSSALAPSSKGAIAEDENLKFNFAQGASHDLRKTLFKEREDRDDSQPNGPGDAAITKEVKEKESRSAEPKDADLCRACEEPKVKGSVFCQKHRRGFQCIYNRCCKKDKQGNYLDAKNAEQFRQIFGEGREGPPNLTLANQVVIDFVRENPEGKDGKKRGTVSLAKYMDQVFARYYMGRIEDDCLWDEELFVNKFKVMRGWSQAYGQQRFKELENDPNVYKDKLGMGGSTRVAVPASWTGEDKQRRGRELGQAKVLERSAKNAKLSDADCAKVEEEISSGGFKTLDVSSLQASASSWAAPLPASSITNLQGDGESVKAVNLVAAAAQKQVEGGGEASPQKQQQLSTKATETSTGRTAEQENQSPAPKKEDLDLKRLKQSRSSDVIVRDHVKKLQEALRKGWQAHQLGDTEDDDLRNLLAERAQIIMHCLGMEPQPSAQKPTEAVQADPAANGGSGGAAGADTAITLKPIEYDEEDR